MDGEIQIVLDGLNPISPAWQTQTTVAFAAMLALMLLDVTIGTVVAFSKQRLSSKVNRQGITRKLVSILMVAAVAVAKALLIQLYPAVESFPIIMFAAGAFALSELISIIESAAEIGVVSPSAAGLAKVLQERVAGGVSIPVQLQAAGMIAPAPAPAPGQAPEPIPPAAVPAPEAPPAVEPPAPRDEAV